MDVMRSVLGMVVLLAIAFLLSVNKKKISLRTVGAALVLQVVIGGIMLWLPPGRWVAEKVAFGVHKVMAYSDAGSAFIFGSLVGPKMDTLFDGAGFIFGFRVLPAIIFVTALVSILYYFNSHSRRYLPESVKYQQDRVIRRGHYHFPRAKRNSGNRQTLYRSAESQ